MFAVLFTHTKITSRLKFSEEQKVTFTSRQRGSSYCRHQEATGCREKDFVVHSFTQTINYFLCFSFICFHSGSKLLFSLHYITKLILSKSNKLIRILLKNLICDKWMNVKENSPLKHSEKQMFYTSGFVLFCEPSTFLCKSLTQSSYRHVYCPFSG